MAQVRHRLDERGLAELADELLLATPGGQRRLLVVVDQFEELLTHTAPGQRARFAQLLGPVLRAPVQVVGTLRTEFLDQLLVNSELAELRTRTYPLRPLSREALRTVIEGPARLAGIAVAEDLVTRLVADTESGEALPLLAFTLAQLADGAGRGGQLSPRCYDRLGGVRGALTRQADAALDEASATSGRSPEEIVAGLLGLVTVDEQGHPTRWRVPREELPALVIRELDAFVRRRLVTTDTNQGIVIVGVAHEAFLSAWTPLAQAIEKNASTLRARRAVEQAATEWSKEGRPPARLWERGQLAAAVTDTGARFQGRDLVTERVELSPTAQAFLRASIRRDRLRRGRAVTVLSVLLLGALIGAGVAVVQQRAAVEQQRTAIVRQLITQAGTIQDTDPRKAILLGIAAERIGPSSAAHASLVHTLTTTRYAGTLTDHSSPMFSVAFSPDGRSLAAGAADGTVIVWDLAKGARPRHVLAAHAGSISSVVFSPDGRTLATGSFEGRVLLWDLADLTRPRQFLSTRAGSGFSVAFSPHGGRLATASDDGTAQVWNLADPTRPQHSLAGHASSVNCVAFAPDGRTLATASDDGTALLWDLADPSRPQRLQPTPSSTPSKLTAVAFAPDGHTVAAASDDGTATLWDLTDSARPQPLRPALSGHTGRLTAVAFAPDGHTLATASSDATVVLWDLTARAQPQRLGQPLTGQPSPVDSVIFAPDGRTLTTTSSDGTVIVRDLTDPGRPRLRQSRTRASRVVDSLAVAPDGHTLVTAGEDGRVILWDLTDRTRPRPLGQPLSGHRGLVASAAFSADGRTLVTAGDDGRVILWDLTDRTRPRPLGQPLIGTAGSVTAVALAPDGNILATGGSDATVVLWNLATLNQLRDHARQRACVLAGGGLDRAEWAHDIPGLPYQDTCPVTAREG